MPHVRLSVIIALLLFAASAYADWPNLRGPHYSGVSDENGLASSWPANGPPVLWRAELGQGYSSFACSGDRVYTLDQSRSAECVACLDVRTGREIWRRGIDLPWKFDSDLPGPRSTPTLAGGRVYYAGAFGVAGCLDARNGSPIWSFNVTETFRGEGTFFGYACSPLVEGGRVFLSAGGRDAAVVALDAKTGSVLWTSGSGPASYASAMPITVGGRRQIVVSLMNVIEGLDPATGNRLWESRGSKGYDEHTAQPLWEEPWLLAPTSFRLGSRCFRLDASGLTPAWQGRVLSNDFVSSVARGGLVYGFDLEDMQPTGERPAAGRFKCIEIATGKVRWQAKETGMASVVAADGKLILWNESGELILARETPERYEEMGRAPIFYNEVCWTAPAFDRGRLFLRAQNQAACVWLADSPPPTTPLKPLPRPAPYHRTFSIWRGSSLLVPVSSDLCRWFAWSLGGVFLPAILLGGLAGRLRSANAARAVFSVAALALGVTAVWPLSRIEGQFVFTWPAALYLACFLALVASMGSKEGGRRARIASLIAGLSFVALCVGYYLLCRNLFLLAGYGFLTGLAIAAPVTVFAAARARRSSRPVVQLLWVLASFTVFFWAAGCFTLWRTRL